MSVEHPLPAASPGFLLLRASNAWQRAVRETLEPWDLTHAQYVVLATLGATGAGAKQHELAGLAGMDPMTTSQVARTLEDKDLVRRSRHPHDGRALMLALTPRGRRVAARVTPAVEALDAAFFRPAGRQRQALLALLTALGAT
jgi:DNA-binding MarR family transcriptional regulator